jgi:radical SAM protein with 4Fe4S-binding SPASM domain
LLRHDLPLLLDFLRRRQVQVTIISNGRLLTEERVSSLLDGGVALFEVPLLSHQRAMHDRLSAAPGAWNGVLSALANIRTQHGQAVTAFVATRLNVGHLYETIKLAFAFGARAIMFNRFNPGGRGRIHLQELLPTVDQVREALAVADSASVEFGIPISCSIPIQPCLIDTSAYPHLAFGFCSVGSERAYYTLDPVGNIRPCNHSRTILGNLFEEPFGDIVSAGRLDDFVTACPAVCARCDRRVLCQGGCKAAAQVCYGSLTELEPFLRQACIQPSRSPGLQTGYP